MPATAGFRITLTTTTDAEAPTTGLVRGVLTDGSWFDTNVWDVQVAPMLPAPLDTTVADLRRQVQALADDFVSANDAANRAEAAKNAIAAQHQLLLDRLADWIANGDLDDAGEVVRVLVDEFDVTDRRVRNATVRLSFGDSQAVDVDVYDIPRQVGLEEVADWVTDNIQISVTCDIDYHAPWGSARAEVIRYDDYLDVMDAELL